MRRSRLRLVCVGVLVAVTACSDEPVAWSDPEPLPPPPSPMRLALDERGLPMQVAVMDTPTVSLTAGACEHTVVVARLERDEWYGAYWRLGPEGNGELVVARSDDGGATWNEPTVADSRDRSIAGCARHAPAIAADSVGGYVHLAYFLDPREGRGIWYTHTMERGALWHWPVAVVFGDRPGRTAIAVQSDTVVIAYEHPGSTAPVLGLAISRTAGHMIEQRMRATGDTHRAVHPDVALRDGRVALSWARQEGPIVGVIGGSVPVAAAAQGSEHWQSRMVRTGTLQSVGP